jgi:hypothetical protein
MSKVTLMDKYVFSYSGVGVSRIKTQCLSLV